MHEKGKGIRTGISKPKKRKKRKKEEKVQQQTNNESCRPET